MKVSRICARVGGRKVSSVFEKVSEFLVCRLLRVSFCTIGVGGEVWRWGIIVLILAFCPFPSIMMNITFPSSPHITSIYFPSSTRASSS